MKTGVYKITNVVNNKCYVGSAVDVKRRIRSHKRDLNKGVHHSILLQRAWDKYGGDSFEFVLIEFVEKEHLISKEQYYLDGLMPEYNICKIAGFGGRLGVRHSDEACRKISLAKLELYKNKENHSQFGTHRSEETKTKLRLAQIGKTPGNKGKKHSLEAKQKMKAFWALRKVPANIDG